MSLTNKQWKDLCDAIQQNECVLLLGPGAATYHGEPLPQLLAERFAQELQFEFNVPPADCPTKLFELVKMYQSKCGTRTNALQKTKEVLEAFYAEFEPTDIPIYRLLADLPLRYIINTSPDDLAKKALIQKEHKPHFFFYHFAKPEHNNWDNAEATNLDQEIDTDRPLLYNLAGHHTHADSVVLTEEDRLKFVEKVLQTDKDGLPPNLAFYFTNKPRFRMRKTYLFVGFDFNEWHLRLLMHLLRRSQEILPQTFTLQNADDLRSEVRFFYNDIFDMVFVGNQSETFLTELAEQLKKREEKTDTPANADALQLLFFYHEDDTPWRERLEKHLAPMRTAGLIDVWHEGKILAGSNREQDIAQKLQTADIIIPLVTANFMASDKLYEQDLQTALKRHESGEAKLVPILMTPYALQGTPFQKLPTFLPKPRGKAVSQKPDPEAVLADIAQEIRDIVERIKKPLKATLS